MNNFSNKEYIQSTQPFNGKDRMLLARLDERTQNIEDKLETFVTKESFHPVKLIAYGLIGTIALGVITAILKSVIIT
tara:strand:+ start:389 stop:619 length:231 start_codon:yes stop_codon:yes gene_type:complete